jgi:hypothetical protein
MMHPPEKSGTIKKGNLTLTHPRLKTFSPGYGTEGGSGV